MAKKGQFKKNASKRTLQQRKYDGSAKVKKKRAMRNTARRRAEKAGLVKKGDSKDVDHKKKLENGGTNAKGNLRVKSRSSNRADNMGRGGRPKGSKNKLTSSTRKNYRHKGNKRK